MEDLETYKCRVDRYRSRAKSIRQEAEAPNITKRRRRQLLYTAERYEQMADRIERTQFGKR